MIFNQVYRKFLSLVFALVIASVFVFQANAARLSPKLQSQLQTLAANTNLGLTIVAFNTSNGLQTSHLNVLRNIGITSGQTFPTLGMVAMPTHAESFEALGIRATLQRLLERHAHLTVSCIGLDLGLQSRRYAHATGIPYGELPPALADFDILIAPLAETAVNLARSDVKLKEYAAAGVAWLASSVGPYAGLGEQQGGRLVPDGEWAPAIEALMNDADARRVLGQRGLRWAAGETIEEHVDVWEGILEDAIAHARSPQGVR